MGYIEWQQEDIQRSWKHAEQVFFRGNNVVLCFATLYPEEENEARVSIIATKTEQIAWIN